MAQGLIRAAAYLPAFTDGTRRLGGPDEDALTMVATAIERAADRAGGGGRTYGIRWVGATPPPDASALSALLGAPVRMHPPVDPSTSLADALAGASAATEPEWVLVVGAGGIPGDGAAALLFDDRFGARPEVAQIRGGAADGDPTGPLARLFSAASRSTDPNVWVGDWHADPRRGRPVVPETQAWNGPPPYTVSQGAFIAAPRDEESRPSRWRLVADRCGTCRALTFPSRRRCRSCGRTDGLLSEALPLDGWTVVALTWIGAGGQPTEFDLQVETTGPYGVVLAEISPEVRVTLPVAEASLGELRVGSQVDTRLRRLYPIEGAWRYGRKAVPASTGRGPSHHAPRGT